MASCARLLESPLRPTGEPDVRRAAPLRAAGGQPRRADVEGAGAGRGGRRAARRCQRLPRAQGGPDGLGHVPGRDPRARRVPAAVLPGHGARAEHRARPPARWARRSPRARSSRSRRSCWCRSTASASGRASTTGRRLLILLVGGMLGSCSSSCCGARSRWTPSLPFPESRACAEIVKAGQARRDRRQVRLRRHGARDADPVVQGRRRDPAVPRDGRDSSLELPASVIHHFDSGARPLGDGRASRGASPSRRRRSRRR